MTRESAATKALRLLSEARVSILLVHRGRVFATVRGDERSYDVSFTNGRWRCPCEARGTCSHLIAVRSVIDVARLDDSPAPSVDLRRPDHRAGVQGTSSFPAQGRRGRDFSQQMRSNR